MDFVHEIPVLIRHFQEGTVAQNAGIVDDDVHTTPGILYGEKW
jgi:hypothetical protein